MKDYIISVQSNGKLYISTEGEAWGHGIEIEPEIWNNLSPLEKDIIYDVQFDEQMDKIYGKINEHY